MEIYIKKLRQFLSTVLTLGLMFCLYSCSSDEFEESPLSDLEAKSAIIKNADGTESLILKTGQSILLEDTVTYVLDFSKNVEEKLLQENDGNLTRAVYYTGFDRKYIEKKNKKYMLKGLEKYGINPNTVYIGKFNTYYKDLPAKSGYSILPSNKKYATEPKSCMGFNPPSLVNVGFHITTSTSAIETAITSSFYVVSDQAGISWNKDVPCNPENYIWLFQYVADE